MEVVHPGISYMHLVDDTPLSVHVVKADPAQCRVLPARALNSGLGRECLTSISERYAALAAINGGYFLVGGSFDGKSRGALKIKERWYSSPSMSCSSVAWNHEGTRVEMSRIAMVWKLSINGIPLPIDGFNVPLNRGLAVLYTWALHRTTLSPPNVVEVAFVDGVVTHIARGKGDNAIPDRGYVYSMASDHPFANHPFQLGMKVSLSHRIGLLNERFEDAVCTQEQIDFWQSCDYIMSGAPLLIQNGVLTEEYIHDRLKESVMFPPHPRAAVGITASGEWLFVVVEGRQPATSIGMSVHELAELMEDLECIYALNLDGGASSLLVVEGKMANEPIFNGIEGLYHELQQRRISDGFVIVPRATD